MWLLVLKNCGRYFQVSNYYTEKTQILLVDDSFCVAGAH